VTSGTLNGRRQSTRKPSKTVPDNILSSCENAGNMSPVAHWNSIDLFKGLKEISIRHNGAEYRLRITAADKLILTK
jgi:hemin uptake protein HemP